MKETWREQIFNYEIERQRNPLNLDSEAKQKTNKKQKRTNTHTCKSEKRGKRKEGKEKREKKRGKRKEG